MKNAKDNFLLLNNSKIPKVPSSGPLCVYYCGRHFLPRSGWQEQLTPDMPPLDRSRFLRRSRPRRPYVPYFTYKDPHLAGCHLKSLKNRPQGCLLFPARLTLDWQPHFLTLAGRRHFRLGACAHYACASRKGFTVVRLYKYKLVHEILSRDACFFPEPLSSLYFLFSNFTLLLFYFFHVIFFFLLFTFYLLLFT